jgi:t-SNARE complex subunit (syntaxin)
MLARFFNGLHWAVGMTTLPASASARDERSFVLMWLGIIVFIIIFFVVFIYLVG